MSAPTAAMRAAVRIVEHNAMRQKREENAPLYPSVVAAIIEDETHAGELRFVLYQIISDLPKKRDWLDPRLEQVARALLARTQPTEGREG